MHLLLLNYKAELIIFEGRKVGEKKSDWFILSVIWQFSEGGWESWSQGGMGLQIYVFPLVDAVSQSKINPPSKKGK